MTIPTTGKLWLAGLLCGLSLCLSAQRPDLIQRPPGQGTSGPGLSAEQRAVLPDTFGVYLYTVSNPNEEQPFSDSLLNGWQRYDPAREIPFDHATLGILGSATQPLRFGPVSRQGLAIGWQQFDLYRLTGHNLNYYRLQRPFTYLSYVQGSEQADGYVQARFSRNFADGLNFLIDYSRIAQLGDLDQYPAQKLRNTMIGTGMSLHSPNGRYRAFLSFTASTFEQQDNGGLRELPELDGDFDTPSSAEVFLQDARTRHAHREWMLTQFLQLGGSPDAGGQPRRAFTLSHQIGLNNSTYRLSAPFAAGDTAFYDRFPALFTDLRGARYYLRHRSLTNTFRLNTFRLSRQADAPRTERDVVEVGLTHRYHDLQQEPVDSAVNNLLLHGRIGLRPGRRFRLLLNGQIGLLDQVGDYRIGGELGIDLGALGRLEVEAVSQLNSPTLLQRQFYLTQQLIWQNSFRNTLGSSLSGAYTDPFLGIRLGAGYHLISNHIYFGADALPAQLDGAVSILQFSAERHFRFGRFNLDNRLLLQYSDNDIIRLPRLFGEHSLYYDGKWFGVLNVNLGLDLHFVTAYRADYFNPFTGQFQLQNEQEVPFQPAVDAFFSMRVTKFRAFVKYANAQTLVSDTALYYTTAFYPNPDAAVRIGISWQLLD